MLNLPVNKVLVRSPLMGSCTCCLNPTILYFLEYYRAIIYFLAAPKKSGESRKLGMNQIQGSLMGMLDYYMQNTNSTQDSSPAT